MRAAVVGIALLILPAFPAAVGDHTCYPMGSFAPIQGSLDANQAVTLTLDSSGDGILHLTMMETRGSLGVMNGGDGQSTLVVLFDADEPAGSSSTIFDSGNAIYVSGGPVAVTTASTTCSSVAFHELDLAISEGKHELTIAHASDDGRTLAYKAEGVTGQPPGSGWVPPSVHAVDRAARATAYFDHTTVPCAHRAAAITPSIVVSALIGCEHTWSGSSAGYHAMMFQAPPDDAHQYQISRGGEPGAFSCHPAGCILAGPSTPGHWRLEVPLWIESAPSREEAGIRVPFFGLTFSG